MQIIIDKHISIVQLCQQRNPSLFPVRLGLFGGESNAHHKVCGVARCGQFSATVACFVDRALERKMVFFFTFDGFESDDRGNRDEFSPVAFHEKLLFHVPSGSLNK